MILCFSGTGNSRAVALLLSGCGADAGEVIWVCPVHAWRVPQLVVRAMLSWPRLPQWIERMGEEAPEGARHHLVLTCGDDVGRAPKLWRRLMQSRGLNTGHVFSVAMPNTYVALPGFDVDPEPLMRAKLEEMPRRVARIAERIHLPGEITDVVSGSFPALKSGPLCLFFRRWLMSPRRFKVSDECTGCGLCARACPTANITIEQERPCFGSKCTTCLACFHACPRRAISRPFTGRHGQYGGVTS